MNIPSECTSFLKHSKTSFSAADPDRRRALAETIDSYSQDSSDEFSWAVGVQSPTLLNHVMNTIDVACRPESQSKPKPVIRLVDRNRREMPSQTYLKFRDHSI